MNGPQITLNATTSDFRRSVGALPWMVFEELAIASTRARDGRWFAALGVRDLAARLGIHKDTAARAVCVLLDHGVVERVTRPACGYLIVSIPAGCVITEARIAEHESIVAPINATSVVEAVEDRFDDRCPQPPDAPAVERTERARLSRSDTRNKPATVENINSDRENSSTEEQGSLF